MNKKYDNNNIIIASRAYFLQIPHTPLWERLSLSISSLIHDHNIYGKLQAYYLF
jgi:hypothetical protein